MAVNYVFLAEFTKAKVATSPANAPTIDIVDAANPGGALLVSGASPTVMTNMAGVYVYVYNTATLTGIPVGLFKTTDSTVDLQHIPSYPQVVLDANGNVLANPQANPPGVTTMVADYARRTGDYSTLAAGAKMDLVDAPNALAVSVIQAGLSTAAKLLEYVKALARKDAPAASADIAGTYDNTTDSQEAAADAIALLAPGAAVVLNADITEIHVP